MVKDDEALFPYWYQVGIVSYGPKECGTLGIPGVYVKVSSFLPWIAENLHI
jgi:secreted trypsin-like serine protease